MLGLNIRTNRYTKHECHCSSWEEKNQALFGDDENNTSSIYEVLDITSQLSPIFDQLERSRMRDWLQCSKHLDFSTGAASINYCIIDVYWWSENVARQTFNKKQKVGSTVRDAYVAHMGFRRLKWTYGWSCEIRISQRWQKSALSQGKA